MNQLSHVVATGCAIAFVCSVTLSAQGSPQAPMKAPAVAPALSAKPYSKLFAQQLSQVSAAFRLNVRPNSARRFICSTPVLPADSAIDPRFEMRPRDTTTRFPMRVVSPSTCY